MPAVSLSPVFCWQHFTTGGLPLSGGLIYTYQAGTSTPQATYTTSAGSVANSNPIVLGPDGRPPFEIWLVNGQAYNLVLKDSLGNLVPPNFDNITGVETGGSVAALIVLLATAAGAAMIGFLQAGAGAVLRTLQSKGRDTVSVKDFGAIGTANPANVTADTAAFAAARASGAKVVTATEGTYYLSDATAGYTVDQARSLIGDGAGKTIIVYTGAGNGIYMGAPGNLVLAYNCVVKGITLLCTNRAATVNGVYLDNAVHFAMEDMEIIGSGNPNSGTPADWVLYGAGVVATNNSIIGRMTGVSCRIWESGMWPKTLSGSPSYWSAAIEICGEGEVANNMVGLRVGDPAVVHASGAGLHFHDMTVQGNYDLGMDLNAAENTSIDHCYFEANAHTDIRVGGAAATPLKVRLLHNRLDSESIGANNYGSAVANEYNDKIDLQTGSQTFVFNNDMAISIAIPLLRNAAACTDTHARENRLLSLNPTAGRIVNASTTFVSSGNTPEAPTVVNARFVRAVAAASGPPVVVSGLGMQPNRIRFWGAVDGTVEWFEGSVSVESGFQMLCTTWDATGLAASTTTECIRLIRGGAGNELTAVLVSMDLDGFTLQFTKIGAPTAGNCIINYIAER